MKFHVYAAAYELQGPTEEVSREEWQRDPEGVTQRLVDNFINWLKGKPELMRDTGQLDIKEGRGAVEYAGVFEVELRYRYKELVKADYHGKIEEKEGTSAWRNKRGRLDFRDVKGHFTRKASWWPE